MIKNFNFMLFNQLLQNNLQKLNPLLAHVSLATLTENSVEYKMFSKEIHPYTRDLISSAKEEVLVQLYKFDPNSDGGIDFLLGLIELDKKNKETNHRIKVKMLVDQRQIGLPGILKSDHSSMDWLQRDSTGKLFIQIANQPPYYLDTLDIECQRHSHLLFNSYHAKEIIIDRKKIMLRSGDMAHDSNYKNNGDNPGRTEISTTIINEKIAKDAAEIFLRRWNNTNNTAQFNLHILDFDKPSLCILEKNASTDLSLDESNESPYKTAILYAIKNTKKEICILTPNFNDNKIINALVDAAKRKVKIKIVMGKYHNHIGESFQLMGGNNKDSVAKYLALIPKEFHPFVEVRWARNFKKEIILDKAPEAMHAKLAIFDQELVITGSSVMDNQSSFFSGEADFVIEDAQKARSYYQNSFLPVFKLGITAHQTNQVDPILLCKVE